MIKALQQKINDEKETVSEWCRKETEKIEKKGLLIPVYSSFDLRDSLHKAAIVDANIFPAGFNNIGTIARQKTVSAFREYLAKFDEKDILILPEEHTRNPYYISNLHAIQGLIQKAGYNAVIGCIRDDNDTSSCEAEDSNGHLVCIQKIHRDGNKLTTKSFKDGLILLNNDFSLKPPTILEGITQKIIPSPELGWYKRKKSDHFKFVDSLSDSFGKAIGIDPWLIRTLHSEADDVDFQNPESLNNVADEVDNLLEKIKQKYDEYKISSEPYVFVKDNSGTYGLGVLSVKSGDEIRKLNSSNRRKMVSGKQRAAINSVIIQEGIPTHHRVNCNPAEPVLYSVGGKVIGGFMRVHGEKGANDSLNRPGMRFDMLLENRITKPLIDHITDETELSLYGLMADIGNFAIAYEYEDS